MVVTDRINMKKSYSYGNHLNRNLIVGDTTILLSYYLMDYGYVHNNTFEASFKIDIDKIRIQNIEETCMNNLSNQLKNQLNWSTGVGDMAILIGCGRIDIWDQVLDREFTTYIEMIIIGIHKNY